MKNLIYSVSFVLLASLGAWANIEARYGTVELEKSVNSEVLNLVNKDSEKSIQWFSQANPFEMEQLTQKVEEALFSHCAGAPQCLPLTTMGATVCNNFRPTCYWVR